MLSAIPHELQKLAARNLLQKRQAGKHGYGGVIDSGQISLFQEIFAFMCAIDLHHHRFSTLPTHLNQPLHHTHKPLTKLSKYRGKNKGVAGVSCWR